MKKLLTFLLVTMAACQAQTPTQSVLNVIGTNTYIGSSNGATLTLGPGSGTITSLASGTGITLTPSTITTTGVISTAQAYMPAFNPAWTGTMTLPNGGSLFASGGTMVMSAQFRPTGGLYGSTSSGASAGNTGEYLSAEAVNSTVSLSNATTVSLFGPATSALTLTPGDWDVGAVVYFVTTSATVTLFGAGLSQSEGNTSTNHATTVVPASFVTYSKFMIFTVPTTRVIVNTNTPMWLNGFAQFSAGSVTAGGFVWARRSANSQ